MATNAYEFKKLSSVESVETPADTANVLIEEDGVIKKVAKKSVGETSEAILGKIATVNTVEEPSDTANVIIEEAGIVKRVPANTFKDIEYDIDIIVNMTFDEEGNGIVTHTVNHINTYDNIKNKILNAIPIFGKIFVKQAMMPEGPVVHLISHYIGAGYIPGLNDGEPEYIMFRDILGIEIILTSDNVIQEIFFN